MRIQSLNPPPAGGFGFLRLSRMESLEARTLLALSATIDTGVLVVSQDAAAQDDALTIEFDASLFSGNGGVRLTAATLGGGTPMDFDASTFDSITVETGPETNDTIDIPSTSDPFSGSGALDSLTIHTGQMDLDANVDVGTLLSLTLTSSSQTNITASIGGTGDFFMDAQGTVRIAAVQSYTGATTVSAGTLEMSADNQLPNGTATMVNGVLLITNLETIGSLEGSGNVQLFDVLTVGGNGAPTEFSGVVSGNNDLVKIGSGTLTLAGDNTYTGETTISDGTLHVTGRVGGGATPAGMVTIASGATLSGGGDAALGKGIVNAAIDGLAGSTILATDDFVIGSDTASILRTFGTLDVNGHTVSLHFSSVAFVTGSGAQVDLGGGTLIPDSPGLQIGSGAMLTGEGTVEGFVTIQNDASLDPGSSPAVLALAQLKLERGVSLSDHGSSLNIRVDGGAGAGQTGGHSQVVVDAAIDGGTGGDGTIDLDNFGLTGAALELTLADLSSSLVGGESLVILDNDGADPVDGIFKRLLVNGVDQGTRDVVEGYVISPDFGGSGLTAVLTYLGGDGNDVAIDVIVPSADLPTSGGSYELVYDTATGDVVVREVGTSNEFFRQAAGSFPSLQINGAPNASDSLTVQLSPTNPLPTGGITFHGGTGGSDGLAVVGGGTDTAVYTPDTAATGNGTIDVNGTSTITFTGLEPIDISGMMTATLVTPPTGGNDTLVIETGSDFFADGTNDALRVNGTTGDTAKGAADGTPIETVAFYNNSTVSVDTTQLDGDDVITVAGASNNHGNENLFIIANAGTSSDDVNIAGNVSLSGSLFVASSQVTQLGGTTSVRGVQVSDGNLTIAGGALQTGLGTSFVSGTLAIGDDDGAADTIALQAEIFAGGLAVQGGSTVGDTLDLAGGSVSVSGPTTIGSNATLEVTSSANIQWMNEATLLGEFTVTPGAILQLEASDVLIPGDGTFRIDDADAIITFASGSTFAIGDGDGQSATVDVRGATPGGIVLQAPGSLSSDPPDWFINDNPADANSITFSNVDVFDSDASGGNSVRAQGGSTLTRTINWQPPNSPPQAVAGGPYDVFEREDLLLDASGSSDPDACCGDSIIEYAWDLDNDGDFTDHVDTTPQTTVSWATLASFSLAVDVPLTIQLRVTDQAGGLTSIDQATLTIAPSEPLPAIVVTPPGTVACDVSQAFDADSSTHSNPSRSIAVYEWDFDYDGTFDVDATGPNVTHTYLQFGTHQTALRLTDDDPLEPQVRIATTVTAVDFTNVAPIADAGGPYTSTITSGAPQPILLDATGSVDANVPCDDIVSFDWDLDGDGQYGADDVDGVHGNLSLPEPVGATASFVDPSWSAGQTLTIAVRVTDQFGAQDFATTIVDVVLPPLPPIADAGGPYAIGTGQGVTLDGSGSSDPNECCGDSIVEYAWDLDGDGNYGETESGQTEPVVSSATVMVDDAMLGAFGINQTAAPFTIRLRVTDGDGLTGEATTTLTIFDDQPVASFTANPNPAACNQSITFDATGSFHTFPGRSIVAWEWDFDDDGQFDDASGPTSHVSFGQFGAFPVRLRVTDDNPSPRTDVAELIIDVNQGNNPPQAQPGRPYVLDVGSDLTLGAGGSTDPDAACGDSIATYQWDLDGDGTDDFSTPDPTLTVPWADIASLPQIQFPADPTSGLPNNTVRLTVTDTLGESASATTTLTIYNNSPQAVIGTTPDPPIVDLGEPVTFDASGSFHGHPDFEITEWLWDFDASDGLSFEETPPQPDATGPITTHTFNSFGSITVTLQVVDNNTPPRSDTAAVTVLVNSPLEVDAGADQSASEGELVSLEPATFHDSGLLDTHTATIEWGDASPVEAGGVSEGPSGSMGGVDGTVTASHVYGDDGEYSVVACVADDEEMSCDTFTVTVANAPPQVDAGTDQTVEEGELFSLPLATFSDMGTLDTHTATIDWGDTSPTEAGIVSESPFGPPGSTGGLNGTIAFPDHVYADNGTYSVTVCVRDDDAAEGCDAFLVKVGNAAPVVSAGPDQTATEGEVVTISAVFSDKGTLDTHTATIDWGDASPTESGIVSENPFGPPGSTDGLEGTIAFPGHVYADDGTYAVTVCVEDDAGIGCDTVVVEFVNVPPIVEAGPDRVIDEGARLTLDPATFTDTSPSQTHTATVDWGDGTPTETGSVDESPIGPPGSPGGVAGAVTFPNHVYADNGTYTVTVTLADDDGGTASDSLAVLVRNLPPSLSSLELSRNVLQQGESAALTGLFTDPGPADAHVVDIDWDGDGVFDDASLPVAGGEFSFGHTFHQLPGEYAAFVRLRDDDGGVTTAARTYQITAEPTFVSGVDLFYNDSFFDRARPSLVAGGGGGSHVRAVEATHQNELADFFAFDTSFTGGVRVATGDVNGDGLPDIITGTGPGGGPHVRVFSGADQRVLLADFFAFEPSLAGGVFVAGGDVNGDGFDDIITGAGAGGGPHVKVFDGLDGTEVHSFFAFEPSFTGGVRVAAGDVNGDGRADVITGAGAGGGPHVRVFSGGDSSAMLADFFAFSPLYTGGVNVAAGDVNGDGFDDIILGADIGVSHVRAIDGQGATELIGDAADEAELQSFFAFDPAFTGGVRVAAGDVNGDGRADIITGAGPGGGPHVRVFSGGDSSAMLADFFAFDPSFTGGVFMAAAVPMGDGPAEAVADQLAIDVHKGPLRFGQTATFANVSSSIRGINGLVVDIHGAPDDGARIDADDFMYRVGNDDFPDAWQSGPAPVRITVLAGAGRNGSDRVIIVFADGAIVDTWLRITVKANADTGLAADEDFFYGNVRGETGAAFQGVGEFFGRGARDYQSIATALFQRVGVGNPDDGDGNGIVDAFDLQNVALASEGRADLNVIRVITPQPGPAAAGGVGAFLAAPPPLALRETDNAPARPRDAKDAAFQRLGEPPDRAGAFAPRLESTTSRGSSARDGDAFLPELLLATAFRPGPREVALESLATKNLTPRSAQG